MQLPTFIKVVLAILLLGFVSIGINQIKNDREVKQIQKIEIKSNEAKLIELDNKYNEVLELKSNTEAEKQEQQKKIQELESERERLERELQAKLDRQAKEQEKLAQAAKKATGTQTASASSVSGDKESWMRQAEISDLVYAQKIVHKESTWRVGVVNQLGCIGLIQACPKGLKPRMVAECPNWANDPVCQLRVAESYMKARYGTWADAWSFHVRSNWW